ncbi:MAG: dihydropteroate synthase [Cyclobacteriaceae bacterium]|nr:dihydropteroate synthase [Cyclobacteriaceae bacterium]
MQNKVFSSNKTLNVGGRLIHFDSPKIMGILNITPDSFFDGGKYKDEKSILQLVEKMITDGADFIDVGGYSSRPGAKDVTQEEELERVLSVIKVIVKNFPESILSIDTFRSEVARQAIEEGALMVNDISGGALDNKMFDLIARHHIPYILMHMKGTPQTMKSMAEYENLISEMLDYFHPRLHQLHQMGVADIMIDPGFGFAKTIAHNFELLKQLELLKILNKPLVIGLSRKSMIWKTLDTNPENALNGTTVLNTIALLKGASILRIHDVKEAVEAVKLTNFVK